MTCVASKYDLALDEARRGIDQQLAELNLIRQRASALMTMGGVLATIFGGLAIREGAEVRAGTWVALAAFVLLAILTVACLYPREMHFGQEPESIITAIDVAQGDADAVTAHLARQIGVQHDSNRSPLRSLVRFFSWSVGAFVVEVIALTFDLAGR